MKITGFGDYLIHFSPIHDERFMQTDYMHMTFTGPRPTSAPLWPSGARTPGL